MSDLISRQDAIRWVKTECNPYGKPTLEFESGKKVIEHLEKMPSADRQTGEWVRKYDKHINCYWYECNQCGEDRPRNVFGKEWSSPYCPNCGAKMGGGPND